MLRVVLLDLLGRRKSQTVAPGYGWASSRTILVSSPAAARPSVVLRWACSGIVLASSWMHAHASLQRCQFDWLISSGWLPPM
ncbi:hypothetical protein [Capillimicrobium parvum]|uniref:hypothetical protein n=1 Tax=Capillimicrobium parvum TaxID=2884022 RepID=UPI00216B1282|nr:hypothetical protein [Capillimicrobium parvum]